MNNLTGVVPGSFPLTPSSFAHIQTITSCIHPMISDTTVSCDSNHLHERDCPLKLRQRIIYWIYSHSLIPHSAWIPIVVWLAEINLVRNLPQWYDQALVISPPYQQFFSKYKTFIKYVLFSRYCSSETGDSGMYMSMTILLVSNARMERICRNHCHCCLFNSFTDNRIDMSVFYRRIRYVQDHSTRVWSIYKKEFIWKRSVKSK
jgi:hypothetical protein